MQPIAFEIPSYPEPLRLLEEAWSSIEREHPGEHGNVARESIASLGPGLVRVTLEIPTLVPVYQKCLDTLVAIDIWCRRAWDFPSIYDGHLRYEAEPPGLEIWASTPAMFARGFADCEDLSCDLVAELALRGRKARPRLRHEDRTLEADYWHVLVEHVDGRFEDPSAALGMR